MKHPADLDLPGMALALDGQRILERLRRELPECPDELELVRLRVMDVAYKPGTQCLIHYRVKLVDPESRRSAWQVLSARVLRRDEPAPRLADDLAARYPASANRTERRAIALRTPTLFLEDERIALWAFPLDPGLPGLLDALDPSTMKRALKPVLRGKVDVTRVDIDLMGYTPQARATFRYQLTARDASSQVPEVRRLIGKMHAYKKAARLFATSWAVWQASRGSIGLAPPVAYLAPLNLTLQEEVRGERLGALTTDKGFTRTLRQVAQQLARLHHLDVPLKNVRTPSDEVQVIRRWSGALGGVHAALAGRVERLRERLVAEVERRARVSGPIHGDFHHTNIMVDGDRVTFIDLDELCMGDPCLDVGRFLASLRVPAMRELGDIDGLAEARAAFLDAYLKQTDEEVERIHLFEAASLLVSAYSAFRVQRPDWSEQAERLIDEAERLAAIASTGAQVRRADPGGTIPPLEARLPWATDAVFMRATLDHHVGKVFGAELTGCRPTRGHTSDHGPRLRYALSGRRDGERWSTTVTGTLRRRRGGRGLLRRIGAVRAAMANETAPLTLPRPVGYLPALLMPVLEVDDGKRLATLVGHPDGERAAEALGHGLAVMHARPVELGKTHVIAEEIDALRARRKHIERSHPTLASAIGDITENLAARAAALPERTAPVLRTLTPHNLLWTGRSVAIAEVHELTLAPALIDVGGIIARLVTYGERTGKASATAAMSTRLASAYRERSGASLEEIGFFVTAALARLAAALAGRDGDTELAQGLLARAAAGGDLERDRAPRTDPTPRSRPVSRRTSEIAAALAASIGERCRDRTAVIGHPPAGLIDGLVAAGVDAHPIGDDSTAGAEAFATVVVADLLHRLEADDAAAALDRAADHLTDDGRLIVFVPNGRRDRDGGGRRLSRRGLKRELRRFGSPHLVKDQPYRWLMMTVDRRPTDAGPRGRVQRERFRVTLDLCRGRILELGCSDGALTRALHERGHDITGLDVSAKKVELARARHPGIRFIHADAQSDVLAGERFDTVLLAEILEHVDDDAGDRILAQAMRLVDRGGRLVVSVPNEHCIPHPGHVRLFDERSLHALLAPLGKVRVVTEQPYKWLMMTVEPA